MTISILRSNFRDNELELRNESSLKWKSTSIHTMSTYCIVNRIKSRLKKKEEFNFSSFCQNQRMDSGQLKHLFIRFQDILNWMALIKQWKNGNLPLPPQRCSKCSVTTQWNRNLTTEMESASKIDAKTICSPQFSHSWIKMQKSHFVLGTLGKCLEMLQYNRDWCWYWELVIQSQKMHICWIIFTYLQICADRNQNVLRNISNTISFHLELIPFTFVPKMLKC